MAERRDTGDETQVLRMLVANEHPGGLEELCGVVESLGHEVVARDLEVGDVGSLTERTRPDVALVGAGHDGEHALLLVSRIVHEATCPVIVVLRAPNPGLAAHAARRGAFACVAHADREELACAISVVLERDAEFRGLRGAFGRRAVIERAKGILMERHGVDEDAAFALLRRHSERSGVKLADVAASVAEAHALLPVDPAAREPA
jgi:AmiR/NasT family two-component response regulator